MLLLRHQLTDISKPIVLGIVNVTPDSFAQHCEALNEESVLRECERLLASGADWLDIGACSTRPGATPISPQEEITRLDIALTAILRTYPDIIISVDTFRSQVANYVLDNYQVDIINDVSGLQDPDMLRVLAPSRAIYILTYPGAPGSEMLHFFSSSLDRLYQAGIHDVILDPGLGFGKTLQQNYECLSSLPLLQPFHCPVMVGLSRKSMIYNVLNTTPQFSLNGTTAAHMMALTQGATILRVHDPKQAKETIQIWEMCSH